MKDEVRLRKRTIVDGFLKAGDRGKKRLLTIPDRVTNTIRLNDGVATRPTVTNCYPGTLPDRQSWWDSWKHFMFDETLDIQDQPISPAKLLVPISRSMYPDLTVQEDQPIPLMAVTLAISTMQFSSM